MAVSSGARAIGLVSDMPSGPGVIDDHRIKEIAAWCPPEIASFLLTSRTDADSVIEHVQFCGTNTVQLVDTVGANAHRKIRAELPNVKIVQVIHVQDDTALEECRRYAETADALLLDSGNPGKDVKELGGTGRIHNWDISQKIVAAVSCPVFLAGGLNPENVSSAIRTVRPYGVDLCSGVRTSGILDSVKLAGFVQAVSKAGSAD